MQDSLSRSRSRDLDHEISSSRVDVSRPPEGAPGLAAVLISASCAHAICMRARPSSYSSRSTGALKHRDVRTIVYVLCSTRVRVLRTAGMHWYSYYSTWHLSYCRNGPYIVQPLELLEHDIESRSRPARSIELYLKAPSVIFIRGPRPTCRPWGRPRAAAAAAGARARGPFPRTFCCSLCKAGAKAGGGTWGTNTCEHLMEAGNGMAPPTNAGSR